MCEVFSLVVAAPSSIRDNTSHSTTATGITPFAASPMLMTVLTFLVLFVVVTTTFTSAHTTGTSQPSLLFTFVRQNSLVRQNPSTSSRDTCCRIPTSSSSSFLSTTFKASKKRSLYLQPNAFSGPKEASRRQPQQHLYINTRSHHVPSKLHMSLIPLDVPTLERIISSSGKPTGAQYATYWGRTMKERYGRTIESATVGFLGVFFAYFLSFIVGGFIATILGSLFFFWGILSPELKAYQRNWEFLGGRTLIDSNIVKEQRLDPEQAGLYGGLFVGHIADVCVVEDTNDTEVDEYDLKGFTDYTMETDELDRYSGQPYLLRIRCNDQLGRTLQVHTRLSEDYLNLQPGMPSAMLLLSTSPRFDKLAALTDIFVLMSNDDDDDSDVVRGCWIGDYPYLDRIEFEALLAEDDELWDALLDERTLPGEESSIPLTGEDDTDYNKNWNKILVPAKGRRKR